MKKAMMVLTLAMAMISTQCWAWDGFDYDTGHDVEIDKGNTVRQGRDIEIYNWDTGEYQDVTVDSIQRRGNSVEIEIYEYDTGTYRSLEMQD